MAMMEFTLVNYLARRDRYNQKRRARSFMKRQEMAKTFLGSKRDVESSKSMIAHENHEVKD